MLSALLSVGLAHAQAVVQESLVPAVALDGRATFGVAAFLDEDLFPRTDTHDGPGFGVSSTYLPGALRVPRLDCHTQTQDSPACVRTYDVAAGSLGVAWNSPYVGVFYAVSWNVAMEHELHSYAVMPFVSLVAPWAFSSLTPLMVGPADVMDTGLFDDGLEYTLGARIFAPYDDGRLGASFGYYASNDRQGFYSTLTESHLRAVASAVFAEGLPYLLGGVQRSPLLWKGVSPIGARALMSSAFVRRIALGTGTEILPDGSSAAASGPALWTGHIEQFNLGPIDVQAAISWKPTVAIHRLTATVHSNDYNADDELGEEDEETVGFGFTGGVVSLPSAPWLAARGGLFPYVEFGVRSPVVQGTIALNHPDVIAAFPYSRNAVLLRWQVAI